MRHDSSPWQELKKGLLDQLQQDYEIATSTVAFGDQVLEYWHPADPESILDDETLLHDHEALPWQPYWAQAWEAGFGMCQHLMTLDLQDRDVLDLGCGIGLTSALLLARGARVVSGDNAPPSLVFTRLNTLPWQQQVSIQPIDWHETRLTQTFDLIAGSDIVYDRKEVKPLDRFFRLHLRPAGQVILADPNRPMTREFLARFAELGWELQESSVQYPTNRNATRIVTMTAP